MEYLMKVLKQLSNVSVLNVIIPTNIVPPMLSTVATIDATSTRSVQIHSIYTNICLYASTFSYTYNECSHKIIYMFWIITKSLY